MNSYKILLLLCLLVMNFADLNATSHLKNLSEYVQQAQNKHRGKVEEIAHEICATVDVESNITHLYKLKSLNELKMQRLRSSSCCSRLFGIPQSIKNSSGSKKMNTKATSNKAYKKSQELGIFYEEWSNECLLSTLTLAGGAGFYLDELKGLLYMLACTSITAGCLYGGRYFFGRKADKTDKLIELQEQNEAIITCLKIKSDLKV